MAFAFVGARELQRDRSRDVSCFILSNYHDSARAPFLFSALGRSLFASLRLLFVRLLLWKLLHGLLRRPRRLWVLQRRRLHRRLPGSMSRPARRSIRYRCVRVRHRERQQQLQQLPPSGHHRAHRDLLDLCRHLLLLVLLSRHLLAVPVLLPGVVEKIQPDASHSSGAFASCAHGRGSFVSVGKPFGKPF